MPHCMAEHWCRSLCLRGGGERHRNVTWRLNGLRESRVGRTRARRSRWTGLRLRHSFRFTSFWTDGCALSRFEPSQPDISNLHSVPHLHRLGPHLRPSRIVPQMGESAIRLFPGLHVGDHLADFFQVPSRRELSDLALDPVAAKNPERPSTLR